MGYNLCIMNNQPLISLSRKVFSLVISVMILLNVFSVVLINNTENIEMSNRFATNVISKYCNMAVMIPMKIVSSFFKANISTDIGTKAPMQATNENKKSKKDNQKEFFQSAVVEDENFSFQFGKNLIPVATIDFQSIYNNNLNNILFTIASIFLFVVLFSGSMILARGDTENIIIKKNINKLVRLV